jgi:hypothetical protein
MGYGCVSGRFQFPSLSRTCTYGAALSDLGLSPRHVRYIIMVGRASVPAVVLTHTTVNLLMHASPSVVKRRDANPAAFDPPAVDDSTCVQCT